jgi:phage tail protein X
MSDEHRLFNNMGDNHATRTAFDITGPSINFGWRFVQGSTNGPGVTGTQFYTEYLGLGNDYPATGAGSYGMQIAYPRNVTEPYITIRYNEANTFTAWQKVSAGNSDKLGGQAGSYYGIATNVTAAFLRANNSLLSSAYTAADVLAKLITVDGAGTALDADLLDGQQGSYYGIATNVTAAFLRANNSLLSSSYTAADVLAKLITVDGAGTTLDADLLDGQQGSYYGIATDVAAANRVANAAFLHANAAFATVNSAFGVVNTAVQNTSSSVFLGKANNSSYIDGALGSSVLAYKGGITETVYGDNTSNAIRNTGVYTVNYTGASDGLIDIGGIGGSSPRIQFRFNYSDQLYFRVARDTEVNFDTSGPFSNKIWHSSNDGAASGLDADLLDGQQGSYYGIASDVTAAFLRANNSLLSSSYTAADVLAKLITVDGAGTALDADLLDGQQGSYYGIATNVTAAFLRANNSLLSSSYTAADVLAKLITVDGAGTTLDADLLDGQHGSYYGIATDVTAANRVANAAFLHANAAFASVNAAFNRANTANITADRAWNHANAAFAKANSGSAIVITPDALNATRYITFEDSTTGNMANANVSTSLTYNPGTNRLALGGTGTPSNTLHVFGTANVSGTLKSAGLYDSTNRLLLIKNSAGTVVWGN